MLSILLNPNAAIPLDPATRQPVRMARRRAEYLVETLGRERQKIVIPTPAAAELLTAIGPDAQQYLAIIARSRLFELAPFDSRCAMELALLNRGLFRSRDPRDTEEPYQKVKFDRQIVAVFKVFGVGTVYTDDAGLARRARLCGMVPIATAALALPTEGRQMRMEFQATDEIPEPDPLSEPEAAGDEP